MDRGELQTFDGIVTARERGVLRVTLGNGHQGSFFDASVHAVGITKNQSSD
jgi:hypothetical protein